MEFDFRWRDLINPETCFEIGTGSSCPFFWIGSEMSSRCASAGILSAPGAALSASARVAAYNFDRSANYFFGHSGALGPTLYC